MPVFSKNIRSLNLYVELPKLHNSYFVFRTSSMHKYSLLLRTVKILHKMTWLSPFLISTYSTNTLPLALADSWGGKTEKNRTRVAPCHLLFLTSSFQCLTDREGQGKKGHNTILGQSCTLELHFLLQWKQILEGRFSRRKPGLLGLSQYGHKTLPSVLTFSCWTLTHCAGGVHQNFVLRRPRELIWEWDIRNSECEHYMKCSRTCSMVHQTLCTKHKFKNKIISSSNVKKIYLLKRLLEVPLFIPSLERYLWTLSITRFPDTGSRF